MNPVDLILDALAARGLAVRPNGQGGRLAQCPAHEDRNPSLSIGVGDDGRVLLRCWAGCPTEDVVDALGLEMRDLFASDSRQSRAPARAPRSERLKPALPSEETIAAWQRALLDHDESAQTSPLRESESFGRARTF